MKILLFGANGQVGWELQRSLAPLGELVALGSAGGDGLVGDFLDPEGIARTVAAVRPQVIVNAAAYTAVDKAEVERDKAWQINALTPGVLAEAAQAGDALLVHYSTDYVFDGGGTRPWTETDTPAPVNFYGAAKLEGERRIARCSPWHLIVRTSWLYAARGQNFAKTMLKLASQKDRLKVIRDQIGAPTGADLLADVTSHMVRTAVSQPQVAGTYHLAAHGETSWYEYARYVLAGAERLGIALRVTADSLEPVDSVDFKQIALRPLNSRLSTSKLGETFKLSMPKWQNGVERMLSEILNHDLGE